MNLICKIFGHKIVSSGTIGRHYMVWCPRCEHVFYEKYAKKPAPNAGGVKSGKWELEKYRRANMVNI